MTVAAGKTPYHRYSPGAAMAPEAIPFDFGSTDDLQVAVVGGAALAYGTDYSITGDHAAGTASITALIDAGAQEWELWSETAREQQLDLQAARQMPLDQYENELDRNARINREQDVALARAPQVPMGETAPPFASLADLEDGDLLEFRDGALQRLDPAPFAGKFYGGDANGRPTPLSGIGADAALRTDLAAGDGELVGTEDGSLVDTVTALKAKDTTHTAFNRKISSANLAPLIAPVYWGAMLGQGPVASDGSDPSQQLGSTFNGAVAAGAYSAVVVSSANFAAGMLCAYLGSDGKYHAITVRSVAGTTLNFDRPAVAAANGAVIGRFYNDATGPHPRQYGSYTIADYLADYDYAKLEVAYEWKHFGEWTTLGSGVSLAASAATGYANTSTNVTGEKSLAVTATVTATGAQLPPVWLPAGTYRLRQALRTGKKSDNTLNSLLVAVEEDFGAGKSYVANSATVEGIDANYLVEFDFTTAGGLIRPYVQTQSPVPGAGSIAWEIGATRILRILEAGIDPWDGPVVAEGDSWFYNPWILDRLETRLPQMVLTRAGVTGNTIDDLRDRFASDVTAHSPRTVLSDFGAANNIAASTVAEDWANQVGQYVRECQAIGAQLIGFDGIVGDVNTGANLSRSRSYVHSVRLEDARLVQQEVFTVALQQPVTIAAGAAWRAFILPFNTRGKVMVDLVRFKVSDADVYFYGGYLGSYDPPIADVDLVDSDLIGGVLSFETGKDSVFGTPVGRIQTYVAANHINALPYLFYFRNNDAASQTVTDLVLRVRALRS